MSSESDKSPLILFLNFNRSSSCRFVWVCVRLFLLLEYHVYGAFSDLTQASNPPTDATGAKLCEHTSVPGRPWLFAISGRLKPLPCKP